MIEHRIRHAERRAGKRERAWPVPKRNLGDLCRFPRSSGRPGPSLNLSSGVNLGFCRPKLAHPCARLRLAIRTRHEGTKGTKESTKGRMRHGDMKTQRAGTETEEGNRR